MRKNRARKFLLKHGGRFLPFLFTFGNAFFGFCSIVLAFQGDRVAAIYCIFLGAMMDALDGRVARLMKVESDLGVELDSLCDAISFCLAPAFLVYVWHLRFLGFIGVILCSLFLLAGLFRLARFNVLHDEQLVFFVGLPTTIAGCFIATVLLNADAFTRSSWFAALKTFNLWGIIPRGGIIPLASAVLLILLAWLMVSSVRFPTFKQKVLRPKKHYHVIAAMILFAVMAVMRFQVALLVLFIGYFVATLGYRLYFRHDFSENKLLH